MTNLRFAAAATITALLSGAAALADEQWKSVTLGDPQFTISVPSAANVQGPSEDPDDLMFFSVTAGLNGSAWCAASRADYPKDMPQAQFAAALATPRRDTFCKNNEATIKDARLLDSASFEHKGLQAATCLASHTDSGKKLPGQVASHMVLAAPRGAYFFTCTIEGETQFDAEGYWTVFWADKVRHMQNSFQPPK